MTVNRAAQAAMAREPSYDSLVVPAPAPAPELATAASALSPNVHSAPLNPNGGLRMLGVLDPRPEADDIGVEASVLTAIRSGACGVAVGVGAVGRLYSDAFFAKKLPQLDSVAFAAAPAVTPRSVAVEAATVAAAVADGASDSGRRPRPVVATGEGDVPEGVEGAGG